MERGQKVIILLSIAILIVLIVIISSFSQGAFEEECKRKATEVLNNLYSIGGSKEEFLKSFSQGTLSIDEQKELQYLKKIINQCPNLKVLSEDNLGIDVSIFKSK